MEEQNLPDINLRPGHVVSRRVDSNGKNIQVIKVGTTAVVNHQEEDVTKNKAGTTGKHVSYTVIRKEARATKISLSPVRTSKNATKPESNFGTDLKVSTKTLSTNSIGTNGDFRTSSTFRDYKTAKSSVREDEIDALKQFKAKLILRRLEGTSAFCTDEWEAKEAIVEFINKDIIGANQVIQTVYGSLPVTYLDYVASGRPLRTIEEYIQKCVLPSYANTHTEISHYAKQTSILREESREIIKKCINANKDDRLIFTGAGATSCINKLLQVLDLKEGHIFVGPFEHHSNLLPWKESGLKVTRIKQTDEGLLDVDDLAKHLKKATEKPIICCFSAASNVTGILTNTDDVSELVHRFGGYCCWDYACGAPYLEIDMNPEKHEKHLAEPYKDAVFISPHKFVGGPGSPGILVAKKWLFRNKVPHCVGGGTVLFVRRSKTRYLRNPEHREEGGTPAIIESIRAGLVFRLKETISHKYIMDKEETFLRRAKLAWSKVPSLIILGNLNVPRLPVFSFLIYNEFSGRFVHQDFIGMVFNDVFGIQVRSGCACAAPYGLDLLGMSEKTAMLYENLIATGPKEDTAENGAEEVREYFSNVIYKPGFARLNLPYFMTESCFQFVLKATAMVAEYGWTLLPQYEFNKKTGAWRHKNGLKVDRMIHLHDVDFNDEGITIDHHHANYDPEQRRNSNSSGQDYDEILRKAEMIFEDAISGRYDQADQRKYYKGQEEDLRWFMLPSEAADLIHDRPLSFLPPEDLPYLPGVLAKRLGINPIGHRGRSQSLDEAFVMEYH